VNLIGYSVRRACAGIFDVYVPLDDLTVLLGANDAGKSTLLRALYEDLRGGTGQGDPDNRDAGAIFAELSEAELKLLFPHRSSSGSLPNVPRWDFGDYGYRLGDAVTAPTPRPTPPRLPRPPATLRLRSRPS
jgi:ABC-type enterochelin transport system ATPase subunit